MLAEALQRWRCEAVYGRDEDWVFASKKKKGKIPRAPGVAAQDYLRPAAVKAGVTPRITRTGLDGITCVTPCDVLRNQGRNRLATIQAMLRHSKPATTAKYLHRVNKTHLEDQGKFPVAIKISPELEELG